MSDALEHLIEIIVGAALFLFAAVVFSRVMKNYERTDSVIAQTVKEKQSIVQEADNINNAAARFKNEEPDYNAEQVYTSIMASDPGISFRVGTTLLEKEEVEAAQAGNEIAIAEIKNAITASKYVRQNIFAHDAAEDYLSEVVFTPAP